MTFFKDLLGDSTLLFSLFAVSLVYLVLVYLVWQILKIRIQKKYSILLGNQGNIKSKYSLKILPANKILEYTLKSRNGKLVQIEEEKVEFLNSVEESEESPGTKRPGLEKRNPGQVSKKIGQAADTGRKVSGVAGGIASILGIIGSLLPGKLGQNLRQSGAQARQVQTKTRQALNAPQATTRKLDALKTEGSRFSSGSNSTAQTKLQQQPPASGGRKRKTQNSIFFRTETKELQPGESIEIQLRVRKAQKKHPENNFVVEFQSLQKPTSFRSGALRPMKQKLHVRFPEIPLWRRFVLPAGLIAVTAAYVYLIWDMLIQSGLV